ncbi:MAG: ABC transporter substrate-binding protein [Muribaculaceae bacterium]|nr:ABC transporter substrate-binding protein [Muribaculaceae bacterium]
MNTHTKIQILSLLIRLLPLCMLIACGAGGSAEEFNKIVYRPSDAGGFEILGAPGRESVIIRSHSPWQGASSSETRDLLIVRGGEAVPSDFRGQVLSEKAERIICMSSGHIAMISLLGDGEKIVGGSSLDFVTSPEIQSRRGDLMEVGHEGSIDYEALVAARPDLVILYGVNSANPMEAKLRELKIPYIYIGDYLEESPLGKAEWLVAIGECLDKRREAIEQYRPIKENYISMKARVDSLGSVKRPKVMLNGPYGDQWMMPPKGSYMVRLIEDAGGEYLYKGGKGNTSQAISNEEALSLMSEADRWLNVGSAFKSLEDIRRGVPLMASSEVVGHGEVYNNTYRSTRAGGNDFYESGIVNPDLILRDLIKIMHPDVVSEPFFYYEQLPAVAPAAIAEEDCEHEYPSEHDEVHDPMP